MDLFLEAVAAARAENPAVRGYVAGEGPERERLEPLAARAGVGLLGAREDVLELLAAAEAMCLPSEAEALPMSIVEAMALARPVVASDVGGTAELVVDGETGFLDPARRRRGDHPRPAGARVRPGPGPRDGRRRQAPPATRLHRRGDGGRIRETRSNGRWRRGQA